MSDEKTLQIGDKWAHNDKPSLIGTIVVCEFNQVAIALPNDAMGGRIWYKHNLLRQWHLIERDGKPWPPEPEKPEPEKPERVVETLDYDGHGPMVLGCPVYVARRHPQHSHLRLARFLFPGDSESDWKSEGSRTLYMRDNGTWPDRAVFLPGPALNAEKKED